MTRTECRRSRALNAWLQLPVPTIRRGPEQGIRQRPSARTRSVCEHAWRKLSSLGVGVGIIETFGHLEIVELDHEGGLAIGAGDTARTPVAAAVVLVNTVPVESVLAETGASSLVVVSVGAALAGLGIAAVSSSSADALRRGLAEEAVG